MSYAFQVPAHLLNQLRTLADKAGVRLSQYIRAVLVEHIDAKKEEKP